MRRQGQFLFRWRSYIPLVMFLPVAFFIRGCRYFCGGYGADTVWKLLCLAVSLAGLAIRILTVGYIYPGTSGRNTKYQEADNLNTSGVYSVVRNPLYLGNIVMYTGVVMLARNFWLSAFSMLFLLLYYERIIYTEECYLSEKYGERYLSWAQKTPLFVPDFRNYRRAETDFNLKLVLKKEFSGVFAIAAAFTLLDAVMNYTASGRVFVGGFWLAYFSINFIFYITVLFLKKKTAILK